MRWLLKPGSQVWCSHSGPLDVITFKGPLQTFSFCSVFYSHPRVSPFQGCCFSGSFCIGVWLFPLSHSLWDAIDRGFGLPLPQKQSDLLDQLAALNCPTIIGCLHMIVGCENLKENGARISVQGGIIFPEVACL